MSSNLQQFFTCNFFSLSYGCFKLPFWQFGTINARLISIYWRVSRDLINLINRSNLVKGRLFAINYLIIVAKSITLYLIWRVGGWFFIKELYLKKNSFYFIKFNVFNHYCSIDRKMQFEYSGLRPDTSGLGVPTFVTKVTKYVCSGSFFSSDKFRLIN